MAISTYVATAHQICVFTAFSLVPRKRLMRRCCLIHLKNSSTCQRYKNRWQVELFFKWIKQHLRIKRFLGTSENAVKTQLWCAIATYVLIAIVKKELHLDASLYTCLQILSVSVFEKTLITCALQTDGYKNQLPLSANQLILFEF